MTPSTTPTSLPKADHNRAPGFIACVTITSAAALILVSLRMYVRLRIVHKFGVDDAIILLAMVYILAPTLGLSARIIHAKNARTDLLYWRPLHQQHASIPRFRSARLSFDVARTIRRKKIEVYPGDIHPCRQCHLQDLGQSSTSPAAGKRGGPYSKIFPPWH